MVDAWVLVETNKPLVLREIELQCLGKFDVEVEMQYAGLCHTQVQEAFGLRGEDRFLPHLFGHEGLGRVTGVGHEVSQIRTGDVVSLGWIPTSGGNDGGKVHRCCDSGEAINSGPVVTLSRKVVVSENRCFSIPVQMQDRSWFPLLSFLGCAFGTGFGLAKRVHHGFPDQASIAIVGGGGVGVAASLFLHCLGFERITIIDTNMDARSRLMKLGFVQVAEPSPEYEGGFDVVIETSGSRAGSEFSYRAAKLAGGRVIFAGNLPHRQTIEIDPFDLLLGKQVEGCGSENCDPGVDYPQIMKLLGENGDLFESIFLGDIYDFSELNVALQDLACNRILRPIIQFGAS